MKNDENEIKKVEISEESIEKLIEVMKEINTKSKKEQKIIPITESDIIIEDEPGKIIKFDKKIYHQMIYTDVEHLKKDTSSLIDDYMNDVKPLVTSINEVLPKFSKRFDKLEEEVESLKRNKPRNFSNWLDDKAKFLSSGGTIFKSIFWIILIIYILSTALPGMFKFIVQFFNGGN